MPYSAPPGEPVAGRVRDLLREAREALGMPVAFVSRIADGRRVVEVVDADGPQSLGPGDSHAVEDTYCQAIVDGRIAQAIPDTSLDSAASALATTRELRVGAHVGVPILLPDGTVYGSLCAYSEAPQPVDDRDSAILVLVARSIAEHLATDLGTRELHREIRDRLAQVMDGGLLQTVYQPIVDMSSGQALALEALTRFPESFGRRTDEWFADATSVGEAAALELAALRQAVRGLTGMPAEVALSVNVSADVVLHPGFVEWLTQVPLDRIVLELTEHEQVADYGPLIAALAPARAAGLRLAVDDAGAGFASMRHTLQLLPELLKLDRSLIRGIDADRNQRALCRAIITFAKTLGTKVVAEGVETAAELLAVRQLGVDYVQGFFLSQPTMLADVRLSGYVPDSAPARSRASVSAEAGLILQEMATAGASPATIAARLNQLGEQSPRGVRWHATSVTEELRRRSEQGDAPA